jgi:hypothetical protein
MKKALSILLIALTCFSIFGCSKNCITMASGEQYCVVKTESCKKFYTNEVLNRVDGPAVVCRNGHKEWWTEGKKDF